jgi:dihydroflavonol-4-reductase
MDNTERKKIAVVTGAEGFIGSSLVHELVDQGWDVVALHFPGGDLMRLTGVPVTLRPCDILIPSDLERTIPENADALFHLAADLRITNRRSDDQYAVNIDGTKNVIEAALKKKVGRFLFTSSMAAFGIHETRIDESAQSKAMESAVSYFITKHLGEAEVDKAIERGLDAVIVNPSNVVGPRDVKNMPATFIRLVHGKKIPTIGSGAASFCHVEDVAAAMVSCIERGRTGERYLLGGADASYYELGKLIQNIVGGQAPFLVVPGWLFRLGARAVAFYADMIGAHNLLTREMTMVLTSTMLVDSSKAIKELGYQPSSLEKMFRDEAEWLTEHGFLGKRTTWVWKQSS